MRHLSADPRKPAVSIWSLALSFILLVFFAFSQPVRAQSTPDPVAPLCVPVDLSALVVPDGQTVRVSEAKEDSGARGSSLDGAMAPGDLGSPFDDRQAKAAYKIFSKEARHGNPAAMVNLAVSSLAGWGTPPNAGNALYWLHEAAERGSGLALYDLGILYFKGCGVRADVTQAFYFFERSARAGYVAAQVNLGYLYDYGLGVKQDHEAAASWYRRAAESGEAHAQYNLADLYLKGEGVEKDETAAFAWFQKAALQGHTKAQIMTGSMLAAGRGTEKDLAGAYFWIFAASLQGDAGSAPMLRVLERELMTAQIEEAKLRARSFLAERQGVLAATRAHTSVPTATTHFPK